MAQDARLAGRSPFPPIADYAFLSDCEATALIGANGSVEWMCVPRMDSPSIFGAMLDRDAGHFRIGPAGVHVPTSRAYLPGTMVVETTWDAPGGWLVVQDALLIGPWRDEHERSQTHRRAATDYDPEHVLLRMLTCVNGELQVALECQPMFDYGRGAARWSFEGDGYHEAVARGEGSDVALRLTTDLRVGFEGPRATARHLMKQGETVFCALSWSRHPAPTTSEDARARLQWTINHWRHWLDRGQFPDHPWRSHLQRSALTLKGLTYAPTGALIAAATTSLPETPGGDRNWDYRFTWIRDATFALWGMHSLGFDWEAVDFFSFIADIASRDDHLQIMYGIGGERELEEFELDHLPGYANSRPVRIGNAAYAQKQHDVWGALLDSVYLHFKAADHVDGRIWPILDKQVNEALKYWREPHPRAWGGRGQRQHFTSSKIMCWVAVDRGARLARMNGDDGKAAEWELAAAEIKEDILANGV